MSKGSIGIIVAIIVFVVLLFVVLGQRSKPEKDTVNKIDVTLPPPKPVDGKADAGPAKDEAPKHVIVEKDGAGWKVYDAAADKKFAADDTIVKTALDAVAEFAPGDPIANKKEKLAEYEIDDAKGTKVKVSTSTGKSLDL